MTRRTNARLAGIMYLLYFAAGITSMIVSRRTTAGAEGIAAKLTSIAQNAPLVGVTVVLALIMAVCAVVLGVTLWALTRDEDRDLATLGMLCRVAEGTNNALSVSRPLALLSLATTSAAAGGGEAAATNVLGRYLMGEGSGAGGAGAFLFALGSLCFCYLLVRSRGIPGWLGWLGLVSSAMWVVGMPLQLGRFIGGAATWALWIPMGVFELIFAVWLIVRGVAAPATMPRPVVHAESVRA